MELLSAQDVMYVCTYVSGCVCVMILSNDNDDDE